jgi:hypothetical protein
MRWKGGEGKKKKKGIRRAISDALLNINNNLKRTTFQYQDPQAI